MSMKKVAVIMGSDSDLPVLKGAFDTLRQLEIPFEAHVYSAHRTPAEAAAFASSAAENGFGVLIAAAGKAAHLAGALAAAQILAVEDAELTAKLRALRQKQHDAVVEKDRKLVID